MQISEFFGLNLSQTEEHAACYLYLHQEHSPTVFAEEIILKANPLLEKLRNLNSSWAQEIAKSILLESYE